MAESFVLTEDIILAKSGKKKHSDVTKINAFAMGVERITSLKLFLNLEVVSLSLNKMTSLKVFSECRALKELHLRKNNISEVAELIHLSGLPGLHTLLLSDNPLTKIEGYRTSAIRMLKHLRKLDSLQVTEQEKIAREEEDKDESSPESSANTSSSDGQDFATCVIDDSRSPPTPPLRTTTTAAAASSSSALDDAPLKSYSNTLLAAKLLLTDMNDSEVKQLQIWCAKELIERNK